MDVPRLQQQSGEQVLFQVHYLRCWPVHAMSIIPDILGSKENQRVTRALKNNGYPSSFIHRSRILTPPPTPASPDGDRHEDREQPPKPRATIALPYVQGLSEPIKRLLSHLVRFRANTTLRCMLMRPKDPVRLEEGSRMRYCIIPSPY